MVDGCLLLAGGILIDNSEGRAGNDVLYAQLLADGLDKGGLSCPHLTVEGKDL